MDSKEREELSELRREQQRLQGELAGLNRKLQDLETRLVQDEELGQAPAKEAAAPITDLPAAPAKTPPPIPEAAKSAQPTSPQVLDEVAKEKAEAVQLEREKPAPTPPEAAPPPTMASASPSQEAQAPTADDPPSPRLRGASGAARKEPGGVQASSPGSWELNLGQVWFVRIGVSLLLTGLVFLSLYAYKNWIFNATALVKVSFFFAISLAMVGGGYFIERRKEELRQYGQVLSAGGLAAGYYTLYAAHFVPALKVIGSPIAVAILLCLWAGGMLAYSAWRQGRVLAVMSIGLAYYGTVINPSGWISLFSSLVLSASAMFLLIRYRWAWVGAIGLIAAYLSHAFWASMVEHEVTESVRIVYLTCTWLLFTFALQVPQSKVIAQNLRRAMLGINNTAFWGLVVFHIPKLFPSRWLDPENMTLHPHEHIGWISIGIGAVWMLIGALSWWRGGWRKEYVMLWGFQGLLVSTLGLMIEASGYSRFLMLAAEACVLLAAARWLAPKWTRLAAMLCFMASSVFALLEGLQFLGDPMPHWLGYAFTALFGFAFITLMRRDVERCSEQDCAAFYGSLHRIAPLFFAWIPWGILVFGAILRWDPEWTAIGLIGAPLAVVAVRLFIERAETLDIPLLSPWVVFFAGGWLLQPQLELPGWSFATSTALLALYWLLADFLRFSLRGLRQEFPLVITRWAEWVSSIAMAILLLRWLMQEDHFVGWMVWSPTIAIAGTVVYLLTRRSSMAICLVPFHVLAIFRLLLEAHRVESFLVSAAPLMGVLAHLVLCELWVKEKFRNFSRPWMGLGICLAFTGFLVANDWNNPALWVTFSSAAWLAYCFYLRHGTSAILGSLIPLFFISLGYAFDNPGGWKAYLCLPILPIAALLIRQLDYQSMRSWTVLRRIGGFVGLILLGAKLSRHVLEVFDAGRAISWGLYAVLLFAVGLVFTDKLFRRFGLFYLLIAVIHILTVDVMKLDTLGRILSFIVLGGVLLLLGFLYNQYQEKIRKYL